MRIVAEFLLLTRDRRPRPARLVDLGGGAFSIEELGNREPRRVFLSDPSGWTNEARVIHALCMALADTAAALEDLAGLRPPPDGKGPCP
jgi:hypothetical protein